MYINDILKESWISIATNRFRSFLTILGIIIGVIAVIIMVTVGETVQSEIFNQFSALGSNTMVIRAGAAKSYGVRTGNLQSLTLFDVSEISKIPNVKAISPIQTIGGQVVFNNKNWSTPLIGVYPDYVYIQTLELEFGMFFNSTAIKNAVTHAVIGPETAKELGLPSNPVGKIIRIQNIPFTIIGILKSRGDSIMGNQDDMILLPITTLKKRLQGSAFPNSVPMVALKIDENGDNNIVSQQLTSLLRYRHNLRENNENDFQIMDMKQIMNTLNQIIWYMKVLLIVIASVSLLVGAIGIMNMMLVSVSERKREIGIRKAVGAKNKNIMAQFLAESITIASIGSLSGLILGLVLIYMVGIYILGFDIAFSIWPFLLSIGITIIVGLLSGVIPAINAAKLNPIDCLRYE